MNKTVILELPKDVMGLLVNYLFATPDGLSMGTTSIDGDDLVKGYKICRGAEGYGKAEIS